MITRILTASLLTLCLAVAENASQSAKYAESSGLPHTWTSAGGMEFILIPPGTFVMGLASEPDATPHPVTISQPFYLATKEMTQPQWKQATGKVHSTYFAGDDHPINCVTHAQIGLLLKSLAKEIAGVRLPTEAEWEYAARAGDDADAPKDADENAWTAENSDNQVRAVGLGKPNAFGLYDMLGNVWEWCADFYDPDYYARSPATDPHGPEKSLYRYAVVRGGSAWCGQEAVRYGNRAFSQIGRPRPDLGVRLAFSVTEDFRKQHMRAGATVAP